MPQVFNPLIMKQVSFIFLFFILINAQSQNKPSKEETINWIVNTLTEYQVNNSERLERNHFEIDASGNVKLNKECALSNTSFKYYFEFNLKNISSIYLLDFTNYLGKNYQYCAVTLKFYNSSVKFIAEDGSVKYLDEVGFCLNEDFILEDKYIQFKRAIENLRSFQPSYDKNLFNN